jgi:hypothetical protein
MDQIHVDQDKVQLRLGGKRQIIQKSGLLSSTKSWLLEGCRAKEIVTYVLHIRMTYQLHIHDTMIIFKYL